MATGTTEENASENSSGFLTGAFQLMRPKQWVKNTFVFAPLFFTPLAVTMDSVAAVLTVFVAFCLVSSGVYCFNDARDCESDRLHPSKRNRPVASGRVSIAAAMIMAVLLVLGGLLLAVWKIPSAAVVLIAYLAINAGYSLGLKKISIVDVMVISVGFVLRLHAGAAVIDVAPTPWIQICGGLLALFIALAKRRDDLSLEIGTEHRASLGGYTKPFLDICIVVTLSALLISYLIFTLDGDAMRRLGSDKIYLTVPYVIAGIFRYVQVTVVFERSGSPTDLLFQDGFLLACVSGWLASYVYMIHF
jgi:decaprenyl-phosphate phosphoribosyltransferase